MITQLAGHELWSKLVPGIERVASNKPDDMEKCDPAL